MMLDRVCWELFQINRNSLERITPPIGMDDCEVNHFLQRLSKDPKAHGQNFLSRIATVRSCHFENLFDTFATQYFEIFRDSLLHFAETEGDLIHSEIPASFFQQTVERYGQGIHKNACSLKTLWIHRQKVSWYFSFIWTRKKPAKCL